MKYDGWAASLIITFSAAHTFLSSHLTPHYVIYCPRCTILMKIYWHLKILLLIVHIIRVSYIFHILLVYLLILCEDVFIHSRGDKIGLKSNRFLNNIRIFLFFLFRRTRVFKNIFVSNVDFLKLW